MTVAAGPYTLDDDMLFQPLAALIDVATTERPDVLILVSVIDAELLVAILTG